jgi:hypothetical protein
MRPVDRGTAPNVYTDYRDARPDLRARLGDYCSYCERQIETHLAVEHIQPQSRLGALRTTWTNFLLSCVNCNSCKRASPINLLDYFWPDRDNTLRALEYIAGGLLQPSLAMPAPIQTIAQATIRLTGLDKYPGNVGREPTIDDLRWLKRSEVWRLAVKNQQMLASNDCLEVRELIVENAISRGMFSIWWTVFSGDVDMKRRLRQAFVGTDSSCFDANEDLQPRAGGQV